MGHSISTKLLLFGAHSSLEWPEGEVLTSSDAVERLRLEEEDRKAKISKKGSINTQRNKPKKKTKSLEEKAQMLIIDQNKVQLFIGWLKTDGRVGGPSYCVHNLLWYVT